MNTHNNVHIVTLPQENKMDEIIDLKKVSTEEEFDAWTQTVQEAFFQYSKECETHVKRHALAEQYFKRWYRYTTYPVIIITAVVSVMATLNVSDDSHLHTDSRLFKILLVVISTLHTILVGYIQFVEYGTRASRHNFAHLGYAHLERLIKREVILKPNERDTPKFDFEIVSRELDAIAVNEPIVPDWIQKKYPL